MITPIIVPMRVSADKVQIPMSVATTKVQLGMSVGVKIEVVAGDLYDGELEVESLLYDSQTLDTKNKLMPDDMIVRPITILDVDNPAGGYTVTIGKFN